MTILTAQKRKTITILTAKIKQNNDYINSKNISKQWLHINSKYRAKQWLVIGKIEQNNDYINGKNGTKQWLY